MQEFHILTENRVTVSKPQIIRKWHNWKQYNKARKKPHPFVVSEGITAESVMEKCEQVRQIQLGLGLSGLSGLSGLFNGSQHLIFLGQQWWLKK